MDKRAAKQKQKQKRRPPPPLHEAIGAAVASRRFFCSFEFSAARDPNPEDLHARIARMAGLNPLWVDVTWGFGGQAAGRGTIEAARRIQKELGLPVLMHLICTEMTLAAIDAALDAAKLAGIRSILALRGYTQAGCDRWQPCAEGPGLDHASDLVAHIIRRHGQHFSIGVAGFPEGHVESKAKRFAPTEEELQTDVAWLKAKVDAGASFILCQFSFEAARWRAFVNRCRAAGIRCPIIPGIQPISDHASSRLLSRTWQVRLPAHVETALAAASDAAAAQALGREFVSELCAEVLAGGGEEEGFGIHLFVYDSESEVRGLLEALAERGWVVGQTQPLAPSRGGKS